MGNYLNPGNSGFAGIRNDTYVDKSGLIGGVETKVDTKGFANDLVTFRDRDDVLTLLIHLGYLSYDETTQKAHILNEEIRLEFARAIRQVRRDDTIRRVRAAISFWWGSVTQKTIRQGREGIAAE